MNISQLQHYQQVQAIAKQVLQDIASLIQPADTEASICRKAVELLRNKGIEQTWYYDVPAFVLLGTRSKLSVSGSEYKPDAQQTVGNFNLVTIDLSPLAGKTWGDCARSFCIEQGQVQTHPEDQDFRQGVQAETQLHQRMQAFVTPQTRFSELYAVGNQLISELGFENLDFLNNLGHSIETDPDARRYIDADCHQQLGEVPLFTFEPHIARPGSPWGFKHENIYYFDVCGQLTEL